MKIAIYKPCHEDWNKMTSNEQGAFCAICTKNVIDFTTKTLDEIKVFFAKPKEGRVCARFKQEQLEVLSEDDFIDTFLGFKTSRKVAMIVAMAVLAWLGSANKTMAQTAEAKGGGNPLNKSEPHSVTTPTVTPAVKMGMVIMPKDTAQCQKKPQPSKPQSVKPPKGKTNKVKSVTTTPKEEKIIMGDVG